MSVHSEPARGIRTVAVTAGYISSEPRIEFYRHMDAANVDLKGFTEEYYRKVCGAELQPVLETLEYLKAETSVWLELTTLLIPGENGSDAEVDRMTTSVADHLGRRGRLSGMRRPMCWRLCLSA